MLSRVSLLSLLAVQPLFAAEQPVLASVASSSTSDAAMNGEPALLEIDAQSVCQFRTPADFQPCFEIRVPAIVLALVVIHA
jgi:hypothetical protein